MINLTTSLASIGFGAKVGKDSYKTGERHIFRVIQLELYNQAPP